VQFELVHAVAVANPLRKLFEESVKMSFAGLQMTKSNEPEHTQNAGMGSPTSAHSFRARRSSSMKSNRRRPSIDPGRLGSMSSLTPFDRQTKEETKKGKFNVLFIGAGNINFGSDEGPWNHSARLEHRLQTRLRVVAIVDPFIPRGESVLEHKANSFVAMAYSECRLCKTLDDFVLGMKPDDAPHAVIIGSPPAFHGSDLPGADLEIQILKQFPKAALFIEKPISTAPVINTLNLAHYLEEKRVVASVGYMLRYLKVIQHMKNIIESTGKPVMMTVARYVCSYAKIKSEVWWNKSKSCGPIVEQGTHLVDLCRYFGGPVLLDTVQATSTEHFEEAGFLEAIPIDEEKIPAEFRNPRTTSAIWKYENGGIASFVHALTLQGTKYSTELEVYLDGWQLKVVDLYNEPTLYVRSPESDAEQRHVFTDDDPYYGEISALIDAAEARKMAGAEASRNESAVADDDDEDDAKSGIIPYAQTFDGILSSFRDACGTYALTWAIKEASERAKKTEAVDGLASDVSSKAKISA